MVPKVLINQLVSSLLLPLGFLTWSNGVSVLVDDGFDAAAAAVAARLRNDYAITAVMSFSAWLPANTLMFLFVPQNARVAFLSTIGCAWGGYISWVAHRDTPA